MLEAERLEANLNAIQELQENPPEHQEPVLFDYVLPMMQELLEAQLAEMEGGFDDEDTEEGAQIVELHVSTYTELQGFLRLLLTEPALDRQLKHSALEIYATIRAEVDGRTVEEVISDLVSSLQPDQNAPEELQSNTPSPEAHTTEEVPTTNEATS